MAKIAKSGSKFNLFQYCIRIILYTCSPKDNFYFKVDFRNILLRELFQYEITTDLMANQIHIFFTTNVIYFVQKCTISEIC